MKLKLNVRSAPEIDFIDQLPITISLHGSKCHVQLLLSLVQLLMELVLNAGHSKPE